MNKPSDISQENIVDTKKETPKQDFDEEWQKEILENIEWEKAEQKESDSEQAWKLKQVLFQNQEMPINDFINDCRKKGLNDDEIAKRLIIQWYSWDEIIKSPIDNIDTKLKNEAERMYHLFAFRFSDREEFYGKFCSIMQQTLVKGGDLSVAIKKMPVKRIVTMEDIKSIKKDMPSADNHIRIDLSGEILPDFDWSESKEVLQYIRFDDKTFSKTPKEHLPKWFDPKEIFEKGKSIGLWIDDVHKMWYTWKWVGVAICDWQLKPHKDIQTEEYTVEKNADNFNDYFHASAVSSILTWKQTWIAPDANLYFYAEVQNNREKDGGQDLASSLTKILQKNERLSDDKKIRVISISWPLYWWKKTEELVKKLEESWVWVLHSGEFWKSFWYLEKKDPMWDPNDFKNYQHYLWDRDALFVNSGDRTIADPKDENAYRHDHEASASWAIPAVAWYYALACQADPTMTPEKFKKLAKDTAKVVKSKIKHWAKIFSKLWLSIRLRVIDIKALIQKIEEEKKK